MKKQNLQISLTFNYYHLSQIPKILLIVITTTQT
jgi:hypothetical protein